jgi:predicted alpha/beta-hydrolase family hydrolase
MAKKLSITWVRGERVTGYLATPRPPERLPAVLLAPGAGGGQRHPFMVAVRDGLAAVGYPTMTFDYRYMEAGRRSPDRPATLLEVHRAAADRLATRYDRVVLIGKSMGGRIGSHLAADHSWPAAGLVYLGYPMVPLGKGEPRSTAHLDQIEAPQLFVSGTRDRLGPPDLIRDISRRLPDAAVSVVDDADHSLRVPKRVGLLNDEVLAGVVGLVAEWLKRCAG